MISSKIYINVKQNLIFGKKSNKMLILAQPSQPCGFHPQKIEIWGYWNCLGKCGKSGEIWQKFRKMCIFALVTGLIKCSECLVQCECPALTHYIHNFTSVSRKVWAKVWNKFVINWYKFVSKFKLILNQSTN